MSTETVSPAGFAAAHGSAPLGEITPRAGSGILGAGGDSKHTAKPQTFLVSVSGGLTSIEAWRRCIEKHGKENTVPVFADVGTMIENGKVVSGEDEDLFRFLGEAEEFLGQKCHRIQHPKYKCIWDAFFGERFVTNGLIDTCSKFLKREILDKFAAQYPGAVRVVGFSWLEMSRMNDFRAYIPNCWFPLAEPPLVTSEEIGQWWQERGIEPPRMYAQGFSHNNCGGLCFKAGLGQAYDVWKWTPWRYEYNERMQERFFAEVSPEGTFLRRKKKPISLKQLRLEFEGGYVPRTSQYQTCGGKCMIPEASEVGVLVGGGGGFSVKPSSAEKEYNEKLSA